jgi:hypothetical protein
MCNVFPASAVCRPRQVLAWDFDLLPNDEILPIEFSRCLKLADAAAGTPGLFRADLLLTGVLFERQLDPGFSFHNGPFHNSRCRLDDLADSNRVAMRNAFRERLAFGVFGPRF